MIRRYYLHFFIVLALVWLAGACSQNHDPTTQPTSRVGQIAVHGRIFLLSVEEAQKAVINLANVGTIPKDDAVRVMEIFKQIGETSQKLASALTLVGEATSAENQATALSNVSLILTSISNLLDSSLIPIGDQSARQAIATLIQGVNKALIELSIQLTRD